MVPSRAARLVVPAPGPRADETVSSKTVLRSHETPLLTRVPEMRTSGWMIRAPPLLSSIVTRLGTSASGRERAGIMFTVSPPSSFGPLSQAPWRLTSTSAPENSFVARTSVDSGRSSTSSTRCRTRWRGDGVGRSGSRGSSAEANGRDSRGGSSENFGGGAAAARGCRQGSGRGALSSPPLRRVRSWSKRPGLASASRTPGGGLPARGGRAPEGPSPTLRAFRVRSSDFRRSSLSSRARFSPGPREAPPRRLAPAARAAHLPLVQAGAEPAAPASPGLPPGCSDARCCGSPAGVPEGPLPRPMRSSTSWLRCEGRADPPPARSAHDSPHLLCAARAAARALGRRAAGAGSPGGLLPRGRRLPAHPAAVVPDLGHRRLEAERRQRRHHLCRADLWCLGLDRHLCAARQGAGR